MLPILNRKNVDTTTITNINNVILAIGTDFPHITIMKSFEVRDYMFFDDVHLSDRKGLPPLVRHIKSEMKITDYKDFSRYRDNDSNNTFKQGFNMPSKYRYNSNNTSNQEAHQKFTVTQDSSPSSAENTNPSQVHNPSPSYYNMMPPASQPILPSQLQMNVPPMQHPQMPFLSPWMYHPFSQWQPQVHSLAQPGANYLPFQGSN